jgi:hypothetical protein
VLEVVQSEVCNARARPRRDVAPTSAPGAPRHGPPPPRRTGASTRVLEVARAFPRLLRASRGLGPRERLEHRSVVRAREGPAVRSPSSGRARPQGAPVHPLVARRLALRYIGATAPLPRRADPPPTADRAARRRSLDAHRPSSKPAQLRWNQLVPHLL